MPKFTKPKRHRRSQNRDFEAFFSRFFLFSAAALRASGPKLDDAAMAQNGPKPSKKRHFQAQNGKNRPKNAVLRHFSVIFAPKTLKNCLLDSFQRRGLAKI